MSAWAPRSRDESGGIAVLVAITSTTIFLIAALVVDLGLARDTRRQSQNAADAAALAAANALYPTTACARLNPDGTTTPPCYADALQAAKDYAQANWQVSASDWAGCSDSEAFWHPAGSTSCISFTDDTLSVTEPARPTKVRVLTPAHDVKTGLGVLAGVDTIPVGASARAEVAGGVSVTCGLCFLGPINAGNADFTVLGGGIAINGDLSSGPNGVWSGTPVGVAGTTSGGQFPLGPPVSTEPFTDPWATNPNVPPSITGLTAKTNPCGSTGGSGIYGAKQLSNNQTCTLNPGLYVIVGAWKEKNNSKFVGNANVTLYFTCGTQALPHVCTGPSDPAGYLDAKNGSITIVAPTTGPRAGLAIVYDRLNSAMVGLQGNGGTSITGAVYAPASLLDFNGNSKFGFRFGPVISAGVNFANGNQSGVTVSDSSDATLPPVPSDVALDQ